MCTLYLSPYVSILYELRSIWSLQTPVYSIISLEPGITYFAINANTGSIFVRRDLRTDPAYLTFYRLVDFKRASVWAVLVMLEDIFGIKLNDYATGLMYRKK